jgi:hypothetical protein
MSKLNLYLLYFVSTCSILTLRTSLYGKLERTYRDNMYRPTVFGVKLTNMEAIIHENLIE